MRNRVAHFWATTIFLLALAGCGGGDDGTPTDPTPPSASTSYHPEYYAPENAIWHSYTAENFGFMPITGKRLVNITDVVATDKQGGVWFKVLVTELPERDIVTGNYVSSPKMYFYLGYYDEQGNWRVSSELDSEPTFVSDPRGGLWVFRNDGMEMAYLEPGVVVPSQYLVLPVEFHECRTRLTNGQGGIWGACSDKLLHYTAQGRLETFAYPNLVAGYGGATSLAEDEQGGVWIGFDCQDCAAQGKTFETTLLHYQNGQFTPVGKPVPPLSNHINQIYIKTDYHDGIWAKPVNVVYRTGYFDVGLGHYTAAEGWRIFMPPQTTSELYMGLSVYTADPSQGAWIGYVQNLSGYDSRGEPLVSVKLAYFDGVSRWQVFPVEAVEQVNSVLPDGRGGFWLSGSSRLLHLSFQERP